MAARQEKIENAVAFFALEHERIARTPLAVSFLDRYLAFFDFACLTRLGRPALGLLYRVMGRGSVLKDLREGRDRPKTERFVLVPQQGGGHVVKATAKPDLSCFSSFEVKEMKRLVKINAARAVRVDDAREKAWAEIESMTMELSREGLHQKPKKGGNMSGLTLLIERYMRQLEELEARAKETKHKLEVVMEASRLLKEEELSEGGPSEQFQ